MSIKQSEYLRILLIAALVLIAGLITNSLSEVFQANCEKYLGGLWWAWLTVFAVFLGILLAKLTTSSSPETTATNQPNAPVQDDVRAVIRKQLKEQYEKRKSQKMGHRLPINLRFTGTDLGIEDVKANYITIEDNQIGTYLRAAFYEAKCRLLLLGEPGAGKTMQMIELALELMKHEEKTVPVLLDLATWSKKYTSLEAWLLEVLPIELQVNKPRAQRFLADPDIFFLFDGFDEIEPDSRALFFQALATYQQSVSSQLAFVISSRINEYTEAAKICKPPIDYQPVLIAPLTKEQLMKELNSLPEFSKRGVHLLSQALTSSDALHKAATNPFLLNCLQSIAVASPNSLQAFSSLPEAEIDDAITEAFIRQELGKCADEQGVQKHLAFVGGNMVKQQLVRLEMTSFQYWWLVGKPVYIVAGLVYGLVGGLVAGPVVGLVAGLVGGLVGSLVGGLVVGLVYGLVVGLVVGLVGGFKKKYDRIYTNDTKFHFSFNMYFFYVRKKLVVGLVAGLFYGLFGGLVAGLVAGLFYGLFGGLFGGLVAGLVDMMASIPESNLRSTHPMQRFYQSARNLHLSILQHWHLRYLMQKRDLIPWDVITFLNEMTPGCSTRKFTKTEVHLMETDGAMWRFRHRIIQEWFAKQWWTLHPELRPKVEE